MIKINPKMFEQGATEACWQSVNAQIDRRRGGGQVIVVVIPDEDFDFVVLSSGNHVDVRLPTHTETNHALDW